MDREQYVNARRGRYMAQALEHFEETCEPLLPADVAENMKTVLRRKIGALASDCIDVMKLEPDVEMNAHAQDLRDRLHPDSSAAPARGRG